MLELPVTLVCIDHTEPALSLAAIEQTLNHCRFAETLFVTDLDLPIEEFRSIRTRAVRSPADRLQVLATDVAAQVRTAHALLIRWDAFVVNPGAWSDDFLDYDYVAPPQSMAGGFAFVSKRLLDALSGDAAAEARDLAGAVASVASRMRDAGALQIAPQSVCERFGFGESYPSGRPFGFEGLFNMWMFFAPPDLASFLQMASPAVLDSSELISLAVNLRDVERLDDARAVFTAILRAHPAHAWAGRLLAQMEPVVPASTPVQYTGVGRNDPCPCGSGRKYKQCHGSLSTAPPAAPPAPQAAPMSLQTAPLQPAVTASDGTFGVRGSLAVLFHRARIALDNKDAALAETLYREVLARIPEDPMATEYLGVSAMQAGRFDEAERLLRQALERSPSAPEFHNNLGLLHHARAEFELAARCFRRALELAPDYAPAHNNLGLALQELEQLDAAIDRYRSAVELEPKFAEAHWNLSLALLKTGNFAEGLAEQEWRKMVEAHRSWWSRPNQFPDWKGEALAGKRILVLAEQGMGDMIQFVRYAEDLAALGATVIVEAAIELMDVMRTVPGVASVVAHGGPYPPCDLQIPVMSLPFRLGTQPDTIPARGRYIQTDPERAAFWRKRLGVRTKPRIGVTWAGNPDHVRDRYRSMPLAALTPLLALSEFEWLGLQKGPASAQIASLPARASLTDMAQESHTFADLAALVDELDCVVGVDTSVVHVAGALGKPTFVLIDSANDWRWMRGRSDTPWYPSARLFRQPARGDWDSVVRDVAAALKMGTPKMGSDPNY